MLFFFDFFEFFDCNQSPMLRVVPSFGFHCPINAAVKPPAPGGQDRKRAAATRGVILWPGGLPGERRSQLEVLGVGALLIIINRY